MYSQERSNGSDLVVFYEYNAVFLCARAGLAGVWQRSCAKKIKEDKRYEII